MSIYVNNILTGFASFPLVALALTLPYLIRQYRRFGSVPFSRSVIVYTFILYCICAYYMVILPLPARDAVISYALTPQLVPFHSIAAILAAATGPLTSLSTWRGILTGSLFFQTFFNVLLLLPLGFYLRYYFRRTWWQTLLIGFSVTLFFELTQLSGLYGWYAQPYRLFDVDDLICNTLGTMLGYWLSLPIGRLLPTVDEIDARAYARGNYASATQRFTAAIIDWVVTLPVVAAVAATTLAPYRALMHMDDPLASLAAVDSALYADRGFGLTDIALWLYVAFVAVFFMVVPCLTHGRTVGQIATRLRTVTRAHEQARWWQYCLRNGLLYLVFIPAPFAVAAYLVGMDDTDLSGWVVALALFVFAVLAVALIVRLVRSALGHPLLLLSGLFSNTRIISDRTGDADALSPYERHRLRVAKRTSAFYKRATWDAEKHRENEEEE